MNNKQLLEIEIPFPDELNHLKKIYVNNAVLINSNYIGDKYIKIEAKNFNTGKSTISHYESNRRLPETNNISTYAEFFGVSLDYIMGRSDIRNINDNKKLSENDNKFFADRIRYLMIDKDINADDIAHNLGITKDEFLDYAKGNYFPTADMLRKIAVAFNTSLDYLLGVTDNPEGKTTSDDSNIILPDYVEVAKSAQDKKIPAKVLNDFIKLYLNRDE